MRIRNLVSSELDVAKHSILPLTIDCDRNAHLRLQHEFIPGTVDRKSRLDHDGVPVRNVYRKARNDAPAMQETIVTTSTRNEIFLLVLEVLCRQKLPGEVADSLEATNIHRWYRHVDA